MHTTGHTYRHRQKREHSHQQLHWPHPVPQSGWSGQLVRGDRSTCVCIYNMDPSRCWSWIVYPAARWTRCWDLQPSCGCWYSDLHPHPYLRSVVFTLFCWHLELLCTHIWEYLIRKIVWNGVQLKGRTGFGDQVEVTDSQHTDQPPVYTWPAPLSSYTSTFKCLFLFKMSWSMPFPASDSSSKHPLICLLQSQNAVSLIP